MEISLENVFVTEGLPRFTFVKPPNYNNILIDVKKKGKPVVIEGQSGSGKTTTILKILEDISPTVEFKYLSARKTKDVTEINKLINEPNNGNYIIDDFHRLIDFFKKRLTDFAKIAADEGEGSMYPKLVIIGINKVGSELLKISPDLSKRCGFHKIRPGDWDRVKTLTSSGEELLNIRFTRPKLIFNESKGDYWLTQLLCQYICLKNDILERQEEPKTINISLKDLRREIIIKLGSTYNEIVKKFVKGIRFRSTNDPYFILLKSLSREGEMPLDISEIANNGDKEIKLAINKIKEFRLATLLKSDDQLNSNFYYNETTKIFNIEDPALFYYIKHLDWAKLKMESGFKGKANEFIYDVAISFAGENRELAGFIVDSLRKSDYEVFFDEFYEANYLGTSWESHFEKIFNKESRYVICILDKYHKEKIWTTFERDCFSERIKDGAVIPIFLDNTKFKSITSDIACLEFKFNPKDPSWKDKIKEQILPKLLVKID